jgi:hypothetical protein
MSYCGFIPMRGAGHCFELGVCAYGPQSDR